ncbi:GGDEF domain-containing protein [Marinomonas transparens]|uniref:diguanylate cyclase n=1 Tax=Marinomonas transparens TaxID=2795388 RepID=A0A934JS32_9GAMM|nr:diguanylate cyclase [Marinomonas transparens]MBJ7537261.1 diguanylate cyclase [Marinomonas transparens]
MRKQVQKLGRLKLVVVITLVASCLAVIGNVSLSFIFDFNTSLWEDIFRAALIPVFVVPFVSWHLAGLFYKIDRLERDVSMMARIDELTLVSNWRFFYQQSDDWHRAESNRDAEYAFFVLDMDFFKCINDRYGHACGDAVLEKFGRILREFAPRPNIIGRIGGEEFAVFLPNMSQATAEAVANKICQGAKKMLIEHEGEQVACSVSIGVSMNINHHQDSIENAFKYADLALSYAKESGRNCYRVYNSDQKRLVV